MARRRRSISRPPPSVDRSPRRAVSLGVAPLFKFPVDPLDDRLLEVQDLRTWHPLGFLRPPGAFVRSAARQVVKSKPNALGNDISSRVGFAVPKKVLVCVRRKQRKEVLHALGKTGGGARVSRRRRRNAWSDVDCT